MLGKTSFKKANSFESEDIYKLPQNQDAIIKKWTEM